MSIFDAELLVVGHVTRDLFEGVERTGGAASYAVWTARELGVKTRLVTSVPAGCPALGELSHPGLQLTVQASRVQTTFQLEHSGAMRRLWVHARADELERATLEGARAPLAYVGPVIGEVDVSLLETLPASRVVLGLQGWLRTLDSDGRVIPCSPPDPAALPAHADVVLSVEDHPEAEALAQRLARPTRVVALTRGADGVSAWFEGGRRDFPSCPARVVDTTGAGDVFGVVYAIRRERGAAPELAIARAQLAAARSIEGPGIGRLADAKREIMG